MRLGEALVAKGIITQEQLGKALNAQLIYGAHLGTCLIELGYIDEDTLGGVLSDVFRVRYAHRDLLQDIPPAVIATLNQSVVEKLRAIPFDLKGRSLHVAMIDPRNLPSLDELSFASGLRIEAWVSPEVRIFQAMERYYELPRRQRYIVLASQLDKKKNAAPVKAVAPAVAAPEPAAAPAPPAAKAPELGLATVALTHSAGAPAAEEAPLVKLRAPADVADVADGAREAPAREPAVQRGLKERLATAAAEICRADDVERLAKITLNHAALEMSCCVLFAVGQRGATIWDSRGLRLDPEKARSVQFAFPSEPLLELLMGEPYYRGPVPADGRYRRFFEVLGIEVPPEILLLPIYHADRIAALFFGGSGPGGSIGSGTEDLLRLMHKLALGLDLIALKSRIQSA
jgi:type II secretion system (T2SS) protein E